MRIWFPAENESQLSVTKAADQTVAVDILPQNLKLKMLSSKDERVVNASSSRPLPMLTCSLGRSSAEL